MVVEPNNGILLEITDLNSLPAAAGKLIGFIGDRKVVLFRGTLGAGKTTFIKAICEYLGVEDPTSSPTFSIVNEYICKSGEKVYHFDFYRLKNENEAFDLGYEEYIYSGDYCFIEWPEKVASLLPGNCVEVDIEVKDNKRLLNIK